MGTVAHPVKNVDTPNIMMLEVSTVLAPYLSINQPIAGDMNVEARPPTLTAPANTVRLQPRSSAIGYMNTARVKLAAAFLTI